MLLLAASQGFALLRFFASAETVEALSCCHMTNPNTASAFMPSRASFVVESALRFVSLRKAQYATMP
jgi:hypothetical protein